MKPHLLTLALVSAGFAVSALHGAPPPSAPAPVTVTATRSSIKAVDRSGKPLYQRTLTKEDEFICYLPSFTRQTPGGFWFGYVQTMDGAEPLPIYLINIQGQECRVSRGHLEFDGRHNLRIDNLDPNTPEARRLLELLAKTFDALPPR